MVQKADCAQIGARLWQVCEVKRGMGSYICLGLRFLSAETDTYYQNGLQVLYRQHSITSMNLFANENSTFMNADIFHRS